MYREPQVSGNCRIHSLNAFFQEPRITAARFAEYSRHFEDYMERLYNTRVSTSEFDLVNSDQNNIVCYIAKQEDPRIATRYFALNYHFLKRQEIEAAIRESEFFFVYTANHIWGVKRSLSLNQTERNQSEKEWYTLDSLAPISRCNIADLLHRQNIGFIVVLPIRSVFRTEYHNLIQHVDPRSQPLRAYDTIVDHIIQLHNSGQILGSIETSINVCVEIIDRLRNDLVAPDKKKMIAQKMVAKYHGFLRVFTNGNYNNIELKIQCLPYTVYAIGQLAPHIIDET